MAQLTPEEMDAEIISFNMMLAHKEGEVYITIHKDLAQSMIDSHTDLSGCNLAQAEAIEELETEIETLKGNAMNDETNTEETTPEEIPEATAPKLTDAIDLSLSELRSTIEIGKSLGRLEVFVNVDAAEYLLFDYENITDADFAEVDEDYPIENAGDLFAEIGDLNSKVVDLQDDIEGHIARVAKRDGTILELQEQIENNTTAHNERVAALTKTIDELQAELNDADAERQEAMNQSDGADVAGEQPEKNDEEE